jgi:protein-tyrosine phosphatase
MTHDNESVVLRHQLAKAGLAGLVTVDSAGTGGWHVGQRMNHGARAQLSRHGYDAEAVPDPYGGTPADFAHVLTMLETGMATLVARLPARLATPPSEPAG